MIFLGKVTEVENPPPRPEDDNPDFTGHARFRFQVSEGFAGVADATAVDLRAERDAPCVFSEFEKDRVYLVVAAKDSEGMFYSPVCADTRPVEAAAAVLSHLRALRDGRTLASLFGVLWRDENSGDDTLETDREPLAATVVRLHSGQSWWQTVSGSDGAYSFSGLPAGSFRLRVGKFSFEDSNGTAEALTLSPGACYERDLVAAPTGSISGRIYDASGRRADMDKVSLFRADRYAEGKQGRTEQPDEDGFFHFDGVAPGHYILVINNENRLDPDWPFLRTFYPGVSVREAAPALELAEGQHIGNADIRLPDPFPTREVLIRVRWQGPLPRMLYLEVRASTGEVPVPWRREPDLFALSTLPDATYVVYALEPCGEVLGGYPSGKKRKTDSVTIRGSDTSKTEVTVTLREPACRYAPPAHQPDLK